MPEEDSIAVASVFGLDEILVLHGNFIVEEPRFCHHR